jgi:hypothetical protein
MNKILAEFNFHSSIILQAVEARWPLALPYPSEEKVPNRLECLERIARPS